MLFSRNSLQQQSRKLPSTFTFIYLVRCYLCMGILLAFLKCLNLCFESLLFLVMISHVWLHPNY